MQNNVQDKYVRAKEKITLLKKFYNGLLSYVVVISGLAILNYYQNEWENAWFLWAAFGWGLGIVFNAIKTFNLNPFFGKNWEQRKIQEIMKENEAKDKWE